jgi:ribosomal protein S18 acetylase RimI-like enzyme
LTRARGLYRSLGFVEEGRLRARVNNSLGVAEDDTLMGWLRPAVYPSIPTSAKDIE